MCVYIYIYIYVFKYLYTYTHSRSAQLANSAGPHKRAPRGDGADAALSGAPMQAALAILH